MASVEVETQHWDPLVRQVACAEHIIDPVVKFKYSNEKGDGYLGVVKAIELLGRNKNLDIIVKYAADSENLRKQTPIREAFLTEMWFYDTIVPAQLAFQLAHKIDNPFVNYPKCYGLSKTDKREILFLENLKQHGYEVWNRKIPMNHEHLEFVFREYGRYHGTNFAMKTLDASTYAHLTSELVDMMEMFNRTEGFSGILTKMSAKVKDYFDPIAERKYHAPIAAFAEKALEHMRSTGEVDDDSIILHGDCWCNNMLFKYKSKDDHRKPDSIQLIDFQLCRQGSPVLDLAYFFYVCSDKPSFDRLEHYMRVYHGSLAEHLGKFGLDADAIYPFALLKRHWKKYSKFGYLMAIFLIKLMQSDADEVPDLADVAEKKAEDANSVMNSFDYESRHEETYQRRMRELVMHFIDEGYL